LPEVPDDELLKEAGMALTTGLRPEDVGLRIPVLVVIFNPIRKADSS